MGMASICDMVTSLLQNSSQLYLVNFVHGCQLEYFKIGKYPDEAPNSWDASPLKQSNLFAIAH